MKMEGRLADEVERHKWYQKVEVRDEPVYRYSQHAVFNDLYTDPFVGVQWT